MDVLYTPGGLKIRLDPHRVELVLASVWDSINLHKAYIDVELWATFPNTFSSVCTMITAFITHSLAWTLITFLVSFAVANSIQTLVYSRILNLIFSTFIGWIISLPLSIAVGLYLYFNNAWLVGMAQLIIVVANCLGYTDLLLFFLLPLRMAIKKIGGVLMGDVEIAFMRILSLQAERAGVELDWTLYNNRADKKSRRRT
ncbi:MAG: hypothetical protein Q7T03_04305 [Deltaproteobacteria bacterium]|nr:hypothetical protein [Deltaproteobacteria bacterium]